MIPCEAGVCALVAGFRQPFFLSIRWQFDRLPMMIRIRFQEQGVKLNSFVMTVEWKHPSISQGDDNINRGNRSVLSVYGIGLDSAVRNTQHSVVTQPTICGKCQRIRGSDVAILSVKGFDFELPGRVVCLHAFRNTIGIWTIAFLFENVKIDYWVFWEDFTSDPWQMRSHEPYFCRLGWFFRLHN